MERNQLIEYYKVRDKMHTGDLLQFSGNGKISSLIKWKTKGLFSHSAMVFDSIDYNRKMVFSAEPRGFMPLPLSDYLLNYNGKVWWFQLRDDWDIKRIEIGGRLLDMSGIGYDYGSFLKQIISKVSADMRDLFCSEAVFLALGFTGIAPDPNKLLDVGAFKGGIKIKGS